MIRAAIALIVSIASAAHGAPADLAGEVNVDRAFRDAQIAAAANEPGAIDAFEKIGAARPVSRWTDDAWAEAARLAERAGQLDRATRDLEHILELGGDEQLRRRTRGALARIAAITGNGRWNEIAADHERLVARIVGEGDPRAALEELEAIVRGNPDYPRSNAARLTIAHGWERDGQRDRSLAWFEQAASHDPGQHAHLELVRGLIRAGELGRAQRAIDAMARMGGADLTSLGELRRSLAAAEQRGWFRRAVWGVLALLCVGAMVVLRRDAGSWRCALRHLARPPIEVLFLIPIAAVMITIAYTGNALIAQAVRAIAIGGIAIAWWSGVLLEAARSRDGRVGARRAIAQAAIAVIAVAAAVYVAIDRDRMIDLVVETWREGPANR